MKKFMKKFIIIYLFVLILILFYILSYDIVKMSSMDDQINNQIDLIDTYNDQNLRLEQKIVDLENENKLMQEKVDRVLTISDAEEVVRVTSAESNGDLQGQMAVMQTILDRSTLWNKTSGEVVNAPSQYANPRPGPINPTTLLALKLVYDDGIRVFEEPTTHFYAYNIVDPAWSATKTSRGIIGGHRFMY